MSCMERSRMSASLPLPMSVRGSIWFRCWSVASTTSTPAVRASSFSSSRLASPSSRLRVRPDTPTRMARSRPPVRRAVRARANSSSSARAPARASWRSSWTEGATSSCQRAPAGFSGMSQPRWTRPGSPSGRVSMAATRSSRSSARSVWSSRVSGVASRWVWTSRRPRRRCEPARARPTSGSVSVAASPTMTAWTSPLRSSRTPTWRPSSRDSSVRWRASSGEITWSASTRRRQVRRRAASWEGLRPRRLPETSFTRPAAYCRWRRRAPPGAAPAATGR